jgi:hypothetical protein
LVAPGKTGGAKAHYDGIVAFSQTDFTEDLKKITVPVLVMHGDDDQIVLYADSGPLSVRLALPAPEGVGAVGSGCCPARRAERRGFRGGQPGAVEPGHERCGRVERAAVGDGIGVGAGIDLFDDVAQAAGGGGVLRDLVMGPSHRRNGRRLRPRHTQARRRRRS